MSIVLTILPARGEGERRREAAVVEGAGRMGIARRRTPSVTRLSPRATSPEAGRI